MVLALARPEVHEQFRPLWADVDVQEIRLAGITRRAAGDLVRRMLGESVGAEALERVVERIVERAAGNALHLEELIRAAGEGRAELPETVLATIQARLETLEPAARRVLRAASVFGRVFWDDAVRALLGPDGARDAAQRWIDELVRRELLTARAGSRFPGAREYAFRHALVLEAVRQTLVDEDARVGHLLAAE